jgi:hypothetical protein
MVNASDDEGSVITSLPTMVPVSTFTRAAMATADAPSADLADRTSWPVTVAAAGGTGVSATWTSLDGPPVSTGTPTRFCHDEVPS